MNNTLSQQYYYGTLAEDFDKWIQNFEQNATLAKLSPGKKLRMFKNSMKGEAALELEKLSTEIKSNYDMLINAFRQLYTQKQMICITETMINFSFHQFNKWILDLFQQLDIGNSILVNIQQNSDKIGGIEYPKGIQEQWRNNNYTPTKEDINYLNGEAKGLITKVYYYYNCGNAIKKYIGLFNDTKEAERLYCIAYLHSYSSFELLKQNYLRTKDKEQMLYSFQMICKSLDGKKCSQVPQGIMGECITIKSNEKLTKDSTWIDKSMILIAKKFIISQLLEEKKFIEVANMYREMIDIHVTEYEYAIEILQEAKYNLAVLTDQTDIINSEEFNWINELIKQNDKDKVIMYDVPTDDN